MADGMTPPESLRQRTNKRIAAMKNDRSSFEAHWRELAEYMAPRRGRWCLDAGQTGAKKHQRLIDGTPLFSARVLASGMMAGLTSPARPWFRLTTPDPELAEFGAVKQWLHTVTTRLREMLAKSNFYNVAPTMYGELGVFGTAGALMLEDDQTLMRFYPQTIGSFWLAQNERQEVDTMYREQRWTVRQVVSRFGLANVSTALVDRYKKGDLEGPVDVMHIVEPNDRHVPGGLGAEGKAWRSCWFETANTEERCLEETGFHEKAILAPRWDLTAEELYGSSPGMAALGDAKALQLQQKRKAQAIDKMVDPPLVGPASLRNQRVSLLPGDVTYLDNASTGAALKSIFDVSLRPDWLLEDTKELQGRIDTAFFADLFLMLAMSDRRVITAREVDERHEEKLLMLGPVLERLNGEFLDPVIDRSFGVMLRRGQIPPPPRELEGMDLKVDYISVLAQAQKRVGLADVDRFTGFVGNLAAMTGKTDVFDKVDTDQLVDEYADMCGVSPRLVVPDDKVQAARAARAEQAQMQQMAQLAQPALQGAQAMSALASTKAEPDSLLAGLGGASVPA